MSSLQENAVSQRFQLMIGIDCAPGIRRPDFYLSKVLKGSGLQVSDFDEPSKFFGAWDWNLKPNSMNERLFALSWSLFSSRLERLFKAGKIRGAALTPMPHFVISIKAA